MDDQQQQKYRAYVRGAATFILLGQKNAPMTAAELVRIFDLDMATVTADIDAIVQSERHKKDGVFEGFLAEIHAPSQTATPQEQSK